MESIYPFSPVYRIDNYVVKRTQSPYDQAVRLAKYLVYLHENKVPVVTLAALTKSNPQLIGDECYVCYPFIEGAAYQGEDGEIVKAGKLLGKIHSLGSKNTFELEPYKVFDFYHDEVKEHMEKINHFVETYDVDIDTERLNDLLHKLVDQQTLLEQAELQWVETPHDYKGNNLVYPEQPVLIDPDNAKWIPRIFDLALVLLLFHNELDSAPHRTFTSREWQLFLRGYKTHQQISLNEIKWWKAAVEHVFLDEVMWLMADVGEDWERKEQRELFVSIVGLMYQLDRYPIG